MATAAVTDEMRMMVEECLGAIEHRAQVTIEQTALSAFRVCEVGEEGYVVLTLAPIKVNDKRSFAVIEGLAGSNFPKYVHLFDAMDGERVGGHAIEVPGDEWNFVGMAARVEEMQAEGD